MNKSSLMCTSTHNEEIEKLFRGQNRILAIELIKLVTEFVDYWPMTLRAFYYQAVAALLVQNTHAQYRRVGNLLKVLRREDLIPWYAMEDKTRSTYDKRGRPDVAGFIEESLKEFLNPQYYQRCLIQEQPVYVELSVEKDALSTLVKDAAWMHCTRISVTRGQPSATMLNNIAERFDKAIMRGLEPILLHFGDLDPTGVQIPKSIQEGLFEHHGIDVDVRQVALTPEQCVENNLPQTFDAAKQSDPNIKRWRDNYGNQAPTELDALHPKILQQLVTASLDEIYDVDEMDEQREKEIEDRRLLKEIRRKTLSFMDERFTEELASVNIPYVCY